MKVVETLKKHVVAAVLRFGLGSGFVGFPRFLPQLLIYIVMVFLRASCRLQPPKQDLAVRPAYTHTQWAFHMATNSVQLLAAFKTQTLAHGALLQRDNVPNSNHLLLLPIVTTSHLTE